MAELIGISLSLGGGMLLFGSYCMKLMAKKAAQRVHVIKRTQDLKYAISRWARENPNQGTTVYATFTGMTKPFGNDKIDLDLVKPFVLNEKIGVVLANASGKPTRIQKFEVIEIRKKGKFLNGEEENEIATIDFGHSLAIDGGKQWEQAVVVRDKKNYESMLKIRLDQELPLLFGESVGLSLFSSEKRYLVGHRIVVSTVETGKEVSGVGLLEFQKLHDDEFVWCLKPSNDKSLNNLPSFLVYGDKRKLLQQQKNSATDYNIGSGLLLISGLALIGGSGFIALKEFKKRGIRNANDFFEKMMPRWW